MPRAPNTPNTPPINAPAPKVSPPAPRSAARPPSASANTTVSPVLVGDAPTIADFSLGGYLFYPVEESGIDIAATHPHLHAWVERLRAIPGWADPYDILPGTRIAPRW